MGRLFAPRSRGRTPNRNDVVGDIGRNESERNAKETPARGRRFFATLRAHLSDVRLNAHDVEAIVDEEALAGDPGAHF